MVKMLGFHYANPHSYTKYRQIVAVAKRTHARVLIETGTYRGVTTRRCLPHFNRVFTIELDRSLAQAAQQSLARYAKCEVIEGDAAKEVPKLCERSDIGSDILFFLDGHFSGGDTALGEQTEPALDIIHAIAKRKERMAAMIVDDFREFGTRSGWPAKSQLVHAIEHSFPAKTFDLVVHMDQVLVMRRVP
jgi:hypothetical protein